MTEAEFLALPESKLRTELVDGQVFVAPSPNVRHQRLVVRIASAFEVWRATARVAVSVGLSPLDVRFAPGRILQPDVFVVLGSVPSSHRGPVDRIPVLCVEVLSTNAARDRVARRRHYAEAGVPELWLVHPKGIVERCTGVGLTEIERVEGILSTPFLPGFSLALDALFAEG